MVSNNFAMCANKHFVEVIGEAIVSCVSPCVALTSYYFDFPKAFITLTKFLNTTFFTFVSFIDFLIPNNETPSLNFLDFIKENKS
jgi:hypothetical protein